MCAGGLESGRRYWKGHKEKLTTIVQGTDLLATAQLSAGLGHALGEALLVDFL